MPCFLTCAFLLALYGVCIALLEDSLCIRYSRKTLSAALLPAALIVLGITLLAARSLGGWDEMLMLLSELNEVKPVWIELGLQTIHERTAEYIRRGYRLEVYEETVERLRACGIEVIVHVILGLPGENKDDMLATVKYVADSGVNGIKLQLLHVLQGTDLAAEFAAGKFEVLSLEQYLDILQDALRLLPPQMVVHRLTGDGNKKELIAPLWSADKKRVLNEIHKMVLRNEKE